MTGRNIDRAYETGRLRGFGEGFNARTDAEDHCCNIEAVAEAYREGHYDGHDQEIVASEAYREGYRDGLAEPRPCTCDLDVWSETFEAGWASGHQAALDGR